MHIIFPRIILVCISKIKKKIRKPRTKYFHFIVFSDMCSTFTPAIYDNNTYKSKYVPMLRTELKMRHYMILPMTREKISLKKFCKNDVLHVHKNTYYLVLTNVHLQMYKVNVFCFFSKFNPSTIKQFPDFTYQETRTMPIIIIS